MILITEMATRAGIHGGYKHKVSWIRELVFSAIDNDEFAFERLPKRFKCVAGKFRKFIKKENTFMCKGDFSWGRIASSAEDRSEASGVMSATERTSELKFVGKRHQRIDFGDFD